MIAGVSKALHPRGTVAVLVQLLPTLPTRAANRCVRTLAVAEAILGFAGVIFPVSAIATAVAASYLAFAVFVVYVRARVGAAADCGCFSPGTSATRLHALVNVTMAICAASVAAAGSSRWLFPLLAHQALDGVPLVAASAAGLWLVVLILVALPRLSEERERVAHERQ